MSVPMPGGATAADFIPVFWDPAQAAWSSKGLVVADVADGRATVLTTHLTAFGATAQSILAEARPLPGAADAGKLLNYSRPENAFALSVVCALLGSFVVAWIVAVRREMTSAEASQVTNARAAMLVIWGSTVVSPPDRVAQKTALRRMQKRLADPDAVSAPDPETPRKAACCSCCRASGGDTSKDKRSSGVWTSVAPQSEARGPAGSGEASSASAAASAASAPTGGSSSASSKRLRPGQRANSAAGSYEGRTAAFVCNVYFEQLLSNHPFAFCFAPVESLAVFTRAQRVAVLAATWLASMAVAAVFFGRQPELVTVRMGVAALSAVVMLPATVFFPMAFRWTTVVRSQLQKGTGVPALKAWHDTLDQAKKSNEAEADAPATSTSRPSVAKVAPAPATHPTSRLAVSSSLGSSNLATATGIRTMSVDSQSSLLHAGESSSIEARLTVPSSSKLASAAFSTSAVDSPPARPSPSGRMHSQDSSIASVTHLTCQGRGLAAELREPPGHGSASKAGDQGAARQPQGVRAASMPLAISSPRSASLGDWGASAKLRLHGAGSSRAFAAQSMPMVVEEGDTPNPADVSEMSEADDVTAMLAAGSSERRLDRVDSTRGQVNETEGLWNRSLVTGRGSVLAVDEREADFLQAALPAPRSFAADAFDGDAGRQRSVLSGSASGEVVDGKEESKERAAFRRAVRATSSLLELDGGTPSRASKSAWAEESTPLPPAPLPLSKRVLLARRHAKEVLRKSPFENGPPDSWTSCMRVATLFVGWCGAALCAAAALLGVAADAVPADLSFATPTVVASLGVLLLVAAIASSAANAAASKAATAAADVGHTVFLRRAAHAAASLQQVAKARKSIAAGATLEQACASARAEAEAEAEAGAKEEEEEEEEEEAVGKFPADGSAGEGPQLAGGSVAASESSSVGSAARRRVSETRRAREGVVSIDALEEAAATAKEAAYVRAGFCGCLGGRWLVTAVGVLVAAMLAQAVAAAVLIFVVKVPLAFEGSLLIAGLEAAVVAVVAVAVLAIRWGARRASDIGRKGEEDRKRVAERLEAEAEEAIRLAGESTPLAQPSGGSTSSSQGRALASSASPARVVSDAALLEQPKSRGTASGTVSLAPSAKERLSMNRAALKIQAAWRGMTARRLILRTKELRTWASMSAERLVLSCLVYMSLMLVVLASTYVCLVFGVVFAPEQARSWLLSSLAGFAMDVLLQKPAVVFLTTMGVLALRACKRDHVLCYNLSPSIVAWRVV